MKKTKRRKETTPQDAALRLFRSLPEPSALVGALAVAAHGYIRATDDVDFVSPVAADEIRKRLRADGIESKSRRGNPLEGDIRSVVHGAVDGIRFDVLHPPVPIDWTRTLLLPIGAASIRVVDLDTLLRLKLKAGGPQDLIDVVQLLRLHPRAREKALATADAYGTGERLRSWIEDPRIRSSRDPTPRPRPKRRK